MFLVSHTFDPLHNRISHPRSTHVTVGFTQKACHCLEGIDYVLLIKVA